MEWFNNVFSSSSSYLLRAAFTLQRIYSVRSAHTIPSSISRTRRKVSVKKTPCDHGSIIACYVRYVKILGPNQGCLDLETPLAKANPAFAATPRSFIAQLLPASGAVYSYYPYVYNQLYCQFAQRPAFILAHIHVVLSFKPPAHMQPPPYLISQWHRNSKTKAPSSLNHPALCLLTARNRFTQVCDPL
jgi:hypothetical protein